MRFYESRAEISATPEEVWTVLVDGQNYTSWDSGVEKFEGAIAPGGTIKVYSEVAPGRAFPVKVVEFEAGQKMTWESGMPLGLFKGRRTFTLTPHGSGTKFHMREEFTGPLLFIIGRTIPDLQPTFDKFANGLKARVEGV
jgi:hypothetical protein